MRLLCVFLICHLLYLSFTSVLSCLQSSAYCNLHKHAEVTQITTKMRKMMRKRMRKIEIMPKGMRKVMLKVLVA